jgi:hypothetical protein
MASNSATPFLTSTYPGGLILIDRGAIKKPERAR